MAYIHGISIQGSPNNTRYYLKSFDIWFKTVVKNLDISKASSVVEDYYAEGGLEPIVKVCVTWLLSQPHHLRVMARGHGFDLVFYP